MCKGSKLLERLSLPLALCFFLTVFIGRPASGQSDRRYRHAIDDPLGRQKSHVYDVSDPYVVRGFTVDPEQLKKILTTGIKRISGIDDPARAWRYFIHDDDVVALVFSPIGAPELGTNDELAEVLLEILLENGFKKKNLRLVGLEHLPKNAQGTRWWTYGWGKRTWILAAVKIDWLNG